VERRHFCKICKKHFFGTLIVSMETYQTYHHGNQNLRQNKATRVGNYAKEQQHGNSMAATW
jgi:hypothetical protein